jgi:pilus assembly protein Flp/PilA
MIGSGADPKTRRKEVIEMLNRFERGQGLVEYALILALIAVVVFAVLALLGTKVRNSYNNLNNSFP